MTVSIARGVSAIDPTSGGQSGTFTSVKVNDGTAAAPSYSFANQTDVGISRGGPDLLGLISQGTYVAGPVSSSVFQLAGGAYLGWAPAGWGGADADLRIFRDAANTLAQRNGTAAQTFRLYNTYTDGANGEWLESGWSGNAATISVKNNGTGVARNLTVKGGSVLYLGAGAGTPVEVGSGYATIAGLTSAGAPIAAAANQVSLGGTTATTVGAAGAAAALPANPVGYININVAGTAMKIPYYNA